MAGQDAPVGGTEIVCESFSSLLLSFAETELNIQGMIVYACFCPWHFVHVAASEVSATKRARLAEEPTTVELSGGAAHPAEFVAFVAIAMTASPTL